MIDIFPPRPTDTSTHDHDLASSSVEDSPSSERDERSHSIHNAIITRQETDMSPVPAHSPQSMIPVTQDTLGKHEPDASPLRILGESAVEGLHSEPTVSKMLSSEGPALFSVKLSEPTDVHDSYIY